MKRFSAILVLVSLFMAPAVRTAAQNATPWIEASASDEFFLVSMPHHPIVENEAARSGELTVNGKRYEAGAEGASYAVWALVNTNDQSVRDVDVYLDSCADLLWEALLKPARDKLPRDGRVRAGMTYVKELSPNPLPGREYSLTIGDLTGTGRFYVADARIYILLAMNSPGGVWARERFFESFTTLPNLPMTRQPNGKENDAGIIAGVTEANDYDRAFNGREVTQKAQVIDKPDPIYTDGARKFGVQGTVILRAVLSRDGQVKDIRVITRLPHGLTQAALTAARRIKFSPALKDGHPVSQYIQLEYNFNLY